jgi:hypothetical protein
MALTARMQEFERKRYVRKTLVIFTNTCVTNKLILLINNSKNCVYRKNNVIKKNRVCKRMIDHRN